VESEQAGQSESSTLTDYRVVEFRKAFNFNNAKLLEIGCWHGGVTLDLIRENCKLTATDARPENVLATYRYLEKHNAHGNPVCEVNALNLSRYYSLDDEIDAVVNFGLLYHTNKPLEILSECIRVSDTMLLDTHYAIDGSQYAQERMDYQSPHVEQFNKLGFMCKTFYELSGDASCGLDDFSYWLTEHSLYSMLRYVGYNLIEEVHRDKEKSRVCLLVTKRPSR